MSPGQDLWSSPDLNSLKWRSTLRRNIWQLACRCAYTWSQHVCMQALAGGCFWRSACIQFSRRFTCEMMNYLCACKLCIKSCSPTNAQNVFAKSTLTSTLETLTHIANAHVCRSLQDGATCKLRATFVCLWVCLASQEQKYLTHDWKRPGATKQGWSWSILMVGIHDFKVHVTTYKHTCIFLYCSACMGHLHHLWTPWHLWLSSLLPKSHDMMMSAHTQTLR